MNSKSRTVPLWRGFRGLLNEFTRDELRAYACELGVPWCRTKDRTAYELCKSGKGHLTISLGRQT